MRIQTGSGILRILLLFALAAHAIGENEDEPYFSISSNRTFGSNGKPIVAMSAWNVDALEFRIYRIIDAVKFFQQLDSAHEFGGRVERPKLERTLLERVHGFKRGLRRNVRLALRGQFTEPPSAHFNALLPKTAPPTAVTRTKYAEAPVLNPEQLVTSFVQPVHSHTRWDTENVELGIGEKGVYLVEAVHKELRAYTILMVSDIVMLTKTGRGRIVNYVADRNDGTPLAGVDVVMVNKEGKRTAAKTDAAGLAELRVTADRPDDLRIVAMRGRDVAASALQSYAFSANIDQWQGYLYTDRPVYRPSHTVHFKGILRLRTPDGYQVPAGKSVQVEIQDPEQKPVFQKTLTANGNGSIQGDFVLPAAAALGYYGIQIHAGESFMNGGFEVQEYKKPEYEVRVLPTKFRILQGEKAQAVIDSRYYFGEPVANAKVKYSVYRGRYWPPYWYDPEDDASDMMGEAGDAGSENEQILEQEGQLDADGKLTINFDSTLSDHKFDYRYRIEANVTDQGKREINGHGSLIATYGSFVLNAQPDRYFYTPGSKATFTIQSRDYDNKPVQTGVHVELIRWDWRHRDRSEVKSATDVTTGPDGTANAEFTIPDQGGSYRVRVSARTPEGRDIEQQTYLWIAGRGEADVYGGSERKTVQIVPDKKSYRPGETAKLAIVTGKPGTSVLVTVEGRDLRSRQILRSEDSTIIFPVPITVTDEPALFVSASFIRNGQLYQSSKYVKVPPEEHKLNIKVATDKPQYTPGESAAYTLEVTSADGKPVPRAELSLGVVDEAIYAIRPDTAGDMLNFFFGHEYNSVFTDSSLEYYFTGEAGKRRMRLASLRPPSKLAQLKPERLVQPKVRKAFPDTTFWATDITTDVNGRAHAKVEFPDSLTTWRATARGVTADTKVGSATLKTIVRKNLILRLAVPRFFVQGDEVVISAIVHNYLADAKTARISLDVTGLDLIDGATKDVQIPSRGETRVDWRVRAAAVRSATVTGKALTNEESDALELQLPVNPPGVKLSQAKGGSLANSADTTFDLTYPAQVEPGSRTLSLRVSPSIAGSLFGALDYLTSFPYGCVEQTMSSFLPNIIVKQAVQELGIKTNLDDAVLQQKIRAGLDRLYGYHHEDGGWGWWETDESHPFMTAYVVAGLVQARTAGISINDRMVTSGADWLRKQNDKLAPDLRAYIAYALALTGDASAAQKLYGDRGKLSPYGSALLGLALETAKDGRAAEIAVALEKAAQQNGEEAWWPASRDEMLDFSADVTPEATAFAVKLLASQRKDSPLLPKAAVWLMNHRNEGYWWSSTKQTAMVVYGLTGYLKASNELNPNLTATVFVNDRQVLTHKFESGTAVNPPDLNLDDAKLQPGANRIRVVSSGQGRLYYSARADYYSTQDKLQKTGTVQLNILRDYFKLVPSKEGDKIVYGITPFNGPAASGDVIAVRLTVTGSEWKYLMIEDPIPSGTEFIERDNLYEIKDKPSWWEYYFSRRELHDDRMAIFQTYFGTGQKQYFYLLKVVNPGMFKVSPARVQPMYQPEFLSTTEARRLEVK